MEIDLGRRIRYFRERANISQLDLEIAIESSAGSVSRIETNKVNPTKETVLKIAEVLEMNSREIDYLIGSSARLVNDIDVAKAIFEVQEYFSKKVYAYLIDDRWRILYLSEYFRRTLNLSEEYVANTLGITSIELLTASTQYGFDKVIAQEYVQEMMINNIPYYFKEVGFMRDDKYFLRAQEAILNNPLSRKIWNELDYERDIKYNFKSGRVVYFKIFGKFVIPFSYTYEPLLKNSRFIVVEFKPDNKFLGILSKLI